MMAQLFVAQFHTGDTAEAVETARRALQAAQQALDQISGSPESSEHAFTMASLLGNYLSVFVVSFVVCLVTVPIARRLAMMYGIVDWPDSRKAHRQPVAYLGGLAVYLGLAAGILVCYLPHFPYHSDYVQHPPTAILLGITLILLTGIVDDVWGLSPRIKVGGQLLAAAALAIEEVGVQVAGGLLRPIGEFVGNPTLLYHIPLPGDMSLFGSPFIELDLVYWAGTAIIAVCVLGACNASNLIDGLDGLLTGVTGITAVGLLVISLYVADTMLMGAGQRPEGLDAARIILSLALLGACLGFLPYNFRPANIFLGDGGSLLLGFATISIILMLGERGFTHLVLAGLIVYALPAIDTTLAIVRRKMAGKPIMSPDDQHLHHMLKRSGLGVRGAVLVLYGISGVFCILGVSLVYFRGRVAYAAAMVLASFVGVTAIKIARRGLADKEMSLFTARLDHDAQHERGKPGASADGGATPADAPRAGADSPE
ncbi:MAG: undecaprenyl/decaprenyl-phosphate alpha-N-acetylglucosaminyl 1-phosphate transferase [Phycisphaerales bacterium]|nr:undecaprenyl/decaprenyl-phosphate alpha-N-acetylglucosaminyl 1-phosphate transferase [Phycisphaerales bacterium]